MSDFQLHGGNVYRQKGILDFSANINPLGMPQEVLEAAMRGVRESEHYPDPVNQELTSAYAAFHGVSPQMIVFGNGAAELIRALPAILRAKRGGLVLPTFGEYEACMKLAGMDIAEVSLEDARNGKLPEKLDLMMLGNPNNPDGCVFSRDEICRLAEKYPETCFLIDESFLPFAMDEQERSCIPALGTHKNLLVLRSFTKIYAMPGLRLGALLGTDVGVISALKNFLQPWTVSRPAQVAGLAALAQTDFVKRTRDFLANERPWLAGKIGALPGVDHIFSSPANFLLFHEQEKETHGLYRALLEKNIQIRDCTSFAGMSRLDNLAGETGWYRIAVKRHDDNQKLVAVMQGIARDREIRNV